MRFEWDTEKEKANVTKHGVDFTEATAAFYDLEKLVQIDVVHSGEEPAPAVHWSHRAGF